MNKNAFIIGICNGLEKRSGDYIEGEERDNNPLASIFGVSPELFNKTQDTYFDMQDKGAIPAYDLFGGNYSPETFMKAYENYPIGNNQQPVVKPPIAKPKPVVKPALKPKPPLLAANPKPVVKPIARNPNKPLAGNTIQRTPNIAGNSKVKGNLDAMNRRILNRRKRS